MSSAFQVDLFVPPLLCAGDQMGREEFLERWRRMPDLKFAELIDGVVYMPSPLSNLHGDHDNLIQGLLFHYAARVPGCQPLANATWLMGPRNAPQPDASLRWVQPGGRSKIVDKLTEGVPEFVAEICYTSRAYDLGPKRALYQSRGVLEYLAIILEGQRMEWRVLENGRYRVLRPHKDGTLRSRVFAGLWLDVEAYWRVDRAALLATLERGIAEAANG